MRILFILIFLLFTTGCKDDKVSFYTDDRPIKVTDNSVVAKEGEPINKEVASKYDYIAENYNKLASQVLVSGINGTSYDKELENYLVQNTPGGIIFFARNITDKGSLKNMILDIKALYKNLNLPEPFFMIDEEGGRVSRLKPLEGKMKSAFYYFTNNINGKTYASDIAKRLKPYGINSPLAPVLDVNNSTASGSIGDRAFTDNPAKLSQYIRDVLQGFRDNKILSVCKHFPGHGSTTVDSHVGLPVINKTKEELLNFDLIPYVENMSLIDGIMVGHLMVPNIDNVPASLSQKFMSEFLRNELNFSGLIVSDDITMGALKEYGNIKERSIKFLDNGGDLLLLCHNIEESTGIINSLKNEFNKEKLILKIDRILKAKEKLNMRIFNE